MKRILVIDNYDSFTYNIVHSLEVLTGKMPAVFRNDQIAVDEVGEYDKIIISPGPGVPADAGICIEVIKRYGEQKNILGICLGHQAIWEAMGGKIVNLKAVFHGTATPIKVISQNDPIFRDIPETFVVGRYHSWAASESHIPDCLEVTCQDNNGIIMGFSHKKFNLRGLQFHPESVLTEHGMAIFSNWINYS